MSRGKDGDAKYELSPKQRDRVLGASRRRNSQKRPVNVHATILEEIDVGATDKISGTHARKKTLNLPHNAPRRARIFHMDLF